MENLLKQKYKLPKSAARSIVAEAKALLKIKHDVMFSKPLELKCVAIAESRGFLENGKRVEKKPQRTTWVPSQPTMQADNLRNRVTQILAQPDSPTRSSRPKIELTPSRSSRPTVSRSSSERIYSSTRSESSGRHSTSRLSSSSHDRTLVKPAKSSSSDRPRRSRFVPSARVSRVLDPIVEASCSTDDESVGSTSERPARRRLRRTPSSDTETTASESGTSTMTVLMPLRDHIMSILGDCTELDVVSDHAKGFRFTDFDSRSYTSLTVSTDGESVSSGGSSLRNSPRKASDSPPRKSVSMGSAEVKSFAMRFDSYGGACVVSAPPRPRRRNSNEDEERPLEPPFRVLNEPPIGVIVTRQKSF